jgi:hypothetical protein
MRWDAGRRNPACGQIRQREANKKLDSEDVGGTRVENRNQATTRRGKRKERGKERGRRRERKQYGIYPFPPQSKSKRRRATEHSTPEDGLRWNGPTDMLLRVTDDAGWRRTCESCTCTTSTHRIQRPSIASTQAGRTRLPHVWPGVGVVDRASSK